MNAAGTHATLRAPNKSPRSNKPKQANGCGQGLSMTTQTPVQTLIRSSRIDLVQPDHLRGHLGVIWGSFDSPSNDMTLSIAHSVVV